MKFRRSRANHAFFSTPWTRLDLLGVFPCFSILTSPSYVTTTLEKQQVFALHTEPDLGVPINLIEPDAYDIDQPMDLPPEDEALLLDDDLVTTKLKRKPEIGGDVTIPWLRKTTYLSSDYSADFKGATVDVTGRKQKRTKYNQEVAELSTEALLAEIEKSFEIGSSAPVHPVQPDLEPVEVLPILPDFELESNEYVHFVLDEDPTSGQQKLVASLGDVSSRAVMRSCQITRGVDGVHYYLPKTKLDAEQDEEQFTLVRDYVYAGKPDHRPGVLFLRHAEAAACINYNPLLARTHLRRVAKAPDNEVLIVNYSGLTEKVRLSA